MNKVILADNQSVFRAGAARLLAIEDDVRIVAQCFDKEHLERAIYLYRGVIVIFGSTLKLDPPELMKKIVSYGSRGIVVLENHEHPRPYFEANVHGLIYRSVTGGSLINYVRSVGRCERAVQILDASLASFSATVPDDAVGVKASKGMNKRELQIAAFVMQGCKNKYIALRLGTTEQVIKNYLRTMYEKLGISDRLQLALFGHQHEAFKAAANNMLAALREVA